MKSGDLEEAERSQQLVSYVNKVLVREHPQVAAIKTALWLKGHPAGITRKPLSLLPEDETKTVYEDLHAMDLLQRNTFTLYTACSSLDKQF